MVGGVGRESPPSQSPPGRRVGRSRLAKSHLLPHHAAVTALVLAFRAVRTAVVTVALPAGGGTTGAVVLLQVTGTRLAAVWLWPPADGGGGRRGGVLVGAPPPANRSNMGGPVRAREARGTCPVVAALHGGAGGCGVVGA